MPLSSSNRKYSSSGPTLKVSKPIAPCGRARGAGRSAGRPRTACPSGVTTSQIIRATFVSPSFQGIGVNVSGSGIATMSDSSIALKPVIDEPSKPIPSSSAASDLARGDREALQVPLDVGEPEQQELDPLVLDPLQHLLARLRIARRSRLALDLRHPRPPFKNTKAPDASAPEAPSPHERSESSGRGSGAHIVRLTAAVLVAESLVQPPHALVAALRPGDHLADAVRPRPTRARGA